MSRSLIVRSVSLFLVPVLILTCAGLLLAAEATKKIHVTATHVVIKKGDGKSHLSTLSAAKITHDDATFTADNVDVRSEGDVHEFTCTGHPVFTDPETRVIADKVIAYSSPRRAECTGNVKMVNTPKPKAPAKGPGKEPAPKEMKEQVKSEPSTLTCDTMSYDYGQKRSIARGNVVVIQKARTVRADEGVYDQKLELITLRGNVRLKNSGDEELKELKDAETVTVSLENEWIDILAKPDGFIEMDLEVKDQPEKGKEPDKGKK